MIKDIKIPFLGEAKLYSRTFQADESNNVTDQVIKTIDRRGSTPEVRYSNLAGDVFIRGYIKDTTFHMSFVVNKSTKNGFNDLSEVYHSLEKDLKKAGITHI